MCHSNLIFPCFTIYLPIFKKKSVLPKSGFATQMWHVNKFEWVFSFSFRFSFYLLELNSNDILAFKESEYDFKPRLDQQFWLWPVWITVKPPIKFIKSWAILMIQVGYFSISFSFPLSKMTLLMLSHLLETKLFRTS